MKKLNIVLAAMLVLALSVGASGYVSDRHDFGEIDFKGATATYVTFIMMNGGVQVREEGGYFKFTMDEPAVIEALRWYYRWNNEENFASADGAPC